MRHSSSKRLSRTLSVCAAFAMAASLAACSTPGGVGQQSSSSSSDSSQSLGIQGDRTGKEILIYMSAGRDYKAYTDTFAAFEKEHNVKINVQYYQWGDLQQKLTADFLSGQTPDLVEENGGWWSTRWGADGNIMSLDPFLQKESGFLDDFVESGLANRQADGKTYGIPLHVTMGGLVFGNKEMMDKAGVSMPKTWDELREASKKIQESGVEYGLALNNDASYTVPFLMQAGVTFTKDGNEPMTPAAKATEAMQFQHDLIYKDKLAPVPVASNDYAAPRKVFTSKRAGFILTGPWDISAVRKEDPNFPLTVGEPLKGDVQKTYLAGSGMMIPSKSQNAELAWQLIKDMTSLKVQEAVTAETGMAMSRKSWANSDVVKNDPILSVVAKSREYASTPDKAFWGNENAAKISDARKVMYEEIILNGKDPAAQVQTYETTVAGLLKQ